MNRSGQRFRPHKVRRLGQPACLGFFAIVLSAAVLLAPVSIHAQPTGALPADEVDSAETDGTPATPDRALGEITAPVVPTPLSSVLSDLSPARCAAENSSRWGWIGATVLIAAIVAWILLLILATSGRLSATIRFWAATLLGAAGSAVFLRFLLPAPDSVVHECLNDPDLSLALSFVYKDGLAVVGLGVATLVLLMVLTKAIHSFALRRS